MKLVFYEGWYRGHAEAVCDPPESWMPFEKAEEIELFIHFDSYELSEWAIGEDEDEMLDNGFKYICLVGVEYGKTDDFEILAKFPAKTNQEAERLLQIAADAIYEEEE